MIDECNKHGGVVHIYVDKNSSQVSERMQLCKRCLVSLLSDFNLISLGFLFIILQGNVYVKCPSIPAAMATVNALHGRWFAGMSGRAAAEKQHLHLHMKIPPPFSSQVK